MEGDRFTDREERLQQLIQGAKIPSYPTEQWGSCVKCRENTYDSDMNILIVEFGLKEAKQISTTECYASIKPLSSFANNATMA